MKASVYVTYFISAIIYFTIGVQAIPVPDEVDGAISEAAKLEYCGLYGPRDCYPPGASNGAS
ncbi:hypothetical protein C8Q75DRAFT_808925 [Abortiporus biennis]|nr:hypothetical protein C8Q75DRAFT_808925 [Abortiporus biennis]